MVAFKYRMGAGFPGDVNRTHPASILPNLADPTNPLTAFGLAVVVNTANNSVRQMQAGDIGDTEIFGVTVRPYPFQASSGGNFGAAPIGSATPPPGEVDVLRAGYIMVNVVGATLKGGAVYVWCAASGGGHTLGGFEAAASGGNTAALDPAKYMFNGPPDDEGNVELIVTI